MTTSINRPVYWECKADGHSKFWAAHIIESKTVKGLTIYTLVRKWGAIGTEGQKMEQTFSDIYDAERELQNLIWEKERKGYKAVF